MATGDTPHGKPIEHYLHKGKTRVNNPPVGLVTPETDPETDKQRTYAYDPHIDPALQFNSQGAAIEALIDRGLAASSLDEAKQALAALKKRRESYLNWAGKAERTSFEVPTVSLHVHERIEPRTIVEAVRKREPEPAGRQLSLFAGPQQNPPLRQAIEFYKHRQGWSNRLIAGDSLLVMSSLLEKEGLAGQVQMIYVDPPYGVRYKSNFQPFVNKRDVSETDRDEDLTQEPEMIRAFRDTWELGIHSYLTYLRDRLLLARELLHPSGSIFVQISDENLHHVREILDEVFGAGSLVVTIPVKKKGSQRSGLIDPVNDYLVWYSKTSRAEAGERGIKFRRLFQKRELDAETLSEFKMVELSDGREFPISGLPDPSGEVRDYRLNPRQLFRDHPGARLFRSNPLTSGGIRKNQSLPYTFNGVTYRPGPGQCWKTTVVTDDGSVPGMDRLAKAGRLLAGAGQLRFKSYLDDFGFTPLSNWWDNLGGAAEPIYVVQTNDEIVARCLLMTTDPGDLVLDPTCGSGTTAYVAEQWGRRWITCDTSRVAIALAKQRLMTRVFDYYELAHPDEGVGSGFRYKQVPHVMLEAIAKHVPPKQEDLYDQPKVDRSKARVTGPFTVEAVPAPAVQPIGKAEAAGGSDESVARSGETLRQAEWRDELLRTGIRGKNGQMILFSRVEPLAGTRWLHADAETKPNALGASSVRESQPGYGSAQRAVIAFGLMDAPLEQRQVELAIEEAQALVPQPKLIVFAAFQFDPEAAKDIDELRWPGVTLLKTQMNTDLLTDDLKKKRAGNQSFWLIGQPDVELRTIGDGEHKGKLVVEVHGFDYYNTRTDTVESGSTEDIAMWMLDPDYDGRSLFPRQVFFTLADDKTGWSSLARTLHAQIDEGLIEQYRGTMSLPFEPGPHRRAAVKIVDDRGIESLKILRID